VAELAILVPVYQVRKEPFELFALSSVRPHRKAVGQGSLTLHVRDDASKKHGFPSGFKAQLRVHPSLYSIDFNLPESRHVGDMPFHGSWKQAAIQFDFLNRRRTA